MIWSSGSHPTYQDHDSERIPKRRTSRYSGNESDRVPGAASTGRALDANGTWRSGSKAKLNGETRRGVAPAHRSAIISGRGPAGQTDVSGAMPSTRLRVPSGGTKMSLHRYREGFS